MNNLKAVKTVKADLPNLKKLYKESFPLKERKPFWYVKHLINDGRGEFLSIFLEDKFCGFIFILKTQNIVLVDYLAIDKSFQGKGIGSKICDLLREKFSDKTIFLEIELPDLKFDNNAQRVKRKKFYLKNGLNETGIHLFVYGTEMEVLTFSQTDFDYEDYVKFMKAVYKKIGFRLIIGRKDKIRIT